MSAIRKGIPSDSRPSGSGGNVLLLELDAPPHPECGGSHGTGASAQRATGGVLEAQRKRGAAAHTLQVVANDGAIHVGPQIAADRPVEPGALRLQTRGGAGEGINEG